MDELKAERRFYVKCGVGSYICRVVNGTPWWGNRKNAMTFEEREAKLRARLGFHLDGRHPGTIEPAAAIIRPDFKGSAFVMTMEGKV